MYQLLRKAIFQLSPETAHDLSLDALSAAERLRLSPWVGAKVPSLPVEVMGLKFKNPVGLAAGLDKNGDHIDGLAALGFGFIEVGTVTPKPQSGNPKPRLFRIPEAQAIINRMGFNNKGVDYLVDRVSKAKFDGIIGINIGKNKNTPAEKAVDDYLYCLKQAYSVADYIAVNLSSPNTPGLRDLQFGEMLDSLLARLKSEQKILQQQYEKYVPIAVKIAPDIEDEDIPKVAKALVENGIDGVIATNTTVRRDLIEGEIHAEEAGGLSGAPLLDSSTEKLKVLVESLQGKIPVVGVGGITEGEHALEKIKAGAQLVQIYSGFIFKGPSLISDSVKSIQMI